MIYEFIVAMSLARLDSMIMKIKITTKSLVIQK